MESLVLAVNLGGALRLLRLRMTVETHTEDNRPLDGENKTENTRLMHNTKASLLINQQQISRTCKSIEEISNTLLRVNHTKKCIVEMVRRRNIRVYS